MIKVTVENVEETIKKLQKISIEKEEEIDKIVRKSAKDVAKEAKNIVPKKTGNLKRSIKPKYFSKHDPAATVFPRGKKGRHRHLIEYGTRKRWHKSGKKVGRVKPKPFMKPAMEKVQPSFIKAIQQEVDKEYVI